MKPANTKMRAAIVCAKAQITGALSKTAERSPSRGADPIVDQIIEVPRLNPVGMVHRQGGRIRCFRIQSGDGSRCAARVRRNAFVPKRYRPGRLCPPYLISEL